jgi:pimeloyl-ACP methyl ester carboxylesterase
MDARFSRLVEVADGDSGRPVTWHVLDNSTVLEQLGVTPVGTMLCVHGNPTWSYLWRGLVAAATDAATTAAETGSGDVWRVIAVDQLEMGFSERTGVERALERR